MLFGMNKYKYILDCCSARLVVVVVVQAYVFLDEIFFHFFGL